jgi:hypothetical protein
MIGRTELCVGAVALLTTERKLDFAVAHQAIRHLRHVCAADGVRGIDTAMAGETCIRAIQLRAKIAWGRQVLSRVDGFRDEGRHVAEQQVFFVAEMREACLRRRRNRDAFVAWLAGWGQRQVVVLNASAMRDRGVATGALGLELQVDAVGERRRVSACAQGSGQNRYAAY